MRHADFPEDSLKASEGWPSHDHKRARTISFCYSWSTQKLQSQIKWSDWYDCRIKRQQVSHLFLQFLNVRQLYVATDGSCLINFLTFSYWYRHLLDKPWTEVRRQTRLCHLPITADGPNLLIHWPQGELWAWKKRLTSLAELTDPI